MALFLDTFFYEFDYFFLKLFHELALTAGNALTPISKFLAVTGNVPFLIALYIGVILLFIPKYRKYGIVMITSIVIGAILTNLAVKPIVFRMRPYQSNVLEFRQWWEFAGCATEVDSSFPSGHTTAASAASLGFFLISKRKRINWVVLLYPIIMACSRVYLCVHYPSDVLAGLIVGSIAAILAYNLINYIYTKRRLA
mgnify:FL=1